MISRTTTFVKKKLSSREKRQLRQRIEEQDALVDQLRSSTIPSLEQRAKELEDQVAAGQRHAGTVSQLSALIGDQAALIGQLRDTIPLLQRRIAEQEREIRRREELLDAGRAHEKGLADALDALRPQAAERDVLRARVAVLERESSALQERLDASRTAEVLHAAALGELEPLRPLPAALAERDLRVADLESTLRHLEDEQYTASLDHARVAKEQADRIETLKTELESLRPLLLKKDTLLDDGSQRVADLEVELDNAKAQVAKAAELEPLRTLPDVVAKKDALIEDMERRLAVLDEQLADKTSALGELRPLGALVEDLRKELGAATARADDKEAERAALAVDIDTLRAQLDDKDALLDNIDQQVTELEKQVDLATALADTRAGALAEKDALIEGLRGSLSALADLDQAKQQLERDLAAAKALAEEKRAELDGLLADKKRLDDELAAARTLAGELEPLRAQLAEKTALAAELEQRQVALDADLKRLRDQHAKGDIEGGAKVGAKVEPADKSDAELAVELEAQKKAAEEHAAALAELEKLRPLVTEKDALVADLAVKSARITDLESALKQAGDNAATLAALKSELETVTGERAKQSATITALNTELDTVHRRLQDELTTAKAELESLRPLRAEKDGLAAQVATISDELRSTKARADEHERAVTELETLRAAVAAKEAAIAELEARVSRVAALEESLAAAEALAKSKEAVIEDLTAEIELLRPLPALAAEWGSLVDQLRKQLAAQTGELDAAKSLATETKNALDTLKTERDSLLGVLTDKDALLKTLNEQLPPLEQRITRLAEMLTRGKTVISEQAALIAQLEPLRGLPGVLAEKEALVQNLHGQLVPLEERITSLADLLEAGKVLASQQTATIAALTAELEPLRPLPHIVTEKDALLANLRGQLAPLENRVKELDEALATSKSLADQQASTIAELEELRRTLPERDARIEELEKNIKRLEDEQLDASLLHAREVKEQADTIVALRSELDALRSTLSDRDAQLSQLDERHAALEAAHYQLLDEHKHRASVVSDLEHRLADKTSLVDRLRGSMAALEQGIVLLRGKLTEQNNLVDQLRDAIPPLQHRIDEQERHVRHLKDELKTRTDTVSALTSEVEPLRALPKELADEKARADKLHASTQDWRQRFNERMRLVKDLEGQLAAKADVIRSMTSELDALRPVPQKLADENRRADQLLESLQELQRRVVEQDRHTHDLAEQHDTLKHEVESLRALPQKLSEERTLVVQLRAALQPLEQRVAKLDRQLKSKNDTIAALRQQATLVDQLERRLHEQELEIVRLEEHLDASKVHASTVQEQAQKIATLSRELDTTRLDLSERRALAEHQAERLRQFEEERKSYADVDALRRTVSEQQDQIQRLQEREREQTGTIATLRADLDPLRSGATQTQVLVEDLRGSEHGSQDLFVESTPRQQRIPDGARTPTQRLQESDTESQSSARQQLEDRIWQQAALLRELREAHTRAEAKLATHKDYANLLQKKLRNSELKLASLQSTSAAREAKLANELVETRQQLELASATASVASLPTIDGDDLNEKDLVTMFNDISSVVYEFSRRVSRKLYRGRREIVMHPHAWALRQVDDYLFQYLRPFLEHSAAASTTVPEAVASTTEAVMHWQLFSAIFASFMPLQFTQSDERSSAFLLTLQQSIQSDVPQEQAARWRSTTYKTLQKTRDDNALVPAISQYMFDTLSLALSVFRDRASVASHLRELWSDVPPIIHMALNWQDRARGSHFAYDYTAYLPKLRAVFVENEMDCTDGPTRAAPGGQRTVMLPLSMGLMASRTESVDEGEGLARVNRVLKKAHVLVAG